MQQMIEFLPHLLTFLLGGGVIKTVDFFFFQRKKRQLENDLDLKNWITEAKKERMAAMEEYLALMDRCKSLELKVLELETENKKLGNGNH